MFDDIEPSDWKNAIATSLLLTGISTKNNKSNALITKPKVRQIISRVLSSDILPLNHPLG